MYFLPFFREITGIFFISIAAARASDSVPGNDYTARHKYVHMIFVRTPWNLWKRTTYNPLAYNFIEGLTTCSLIQTDYVCSPWDIKKGPKNVDGKEGRRKNYVRHGVGRTQCSAEWKGSDVDVSSRLCLYKALLYYMHYAQGSSLQRILGRDVRLSLEQGYQFIPPEDRRGICGHPWHTLKVWCSIWEVAWIKQLTHFNKSTASIQKEPLPDQELVGNSSAAPKAIWACARLRRN